MRSTLRWLIRSLCLLALVAAIAAWVTSSFAGVSLSRIRAGRFRVAGIVQGDCIVGGIDNFPLRDEPLQPNVEGVDTASGWLPEPNTLGFYAGPVPGRRDSFVIIFPLWLPTLLLTGFNYFAWRKAFRRTPRGAFPIEPTKKAEG